MTNEELVILIQSKEDVRHNMGLLYQQNERFIYKVVLPYIKFLGSTSLDKEDLLQEAYFGLVEAVNRFDADSGNKFITYAKYWIKTKVHRYIENHGRAKRIPSYELQLVSKYNQIRKSFSNYNDREPTSNDYMTILRLSKKQLEALEKCMREMYCQSIHDPVHGADGIDLSDTIRDTFNLEDTVLDDLCIEQDKAIIWGAIGELDSRYIAIMKCRYKDNMTRTKIAQQHGVCGSRIRQIESDALRKLRCNQQLKELAQLYGYGSKSAYHYGLQRFRETGISCTEFLALNRIDNDIG